jgi:hypothetical protein
MLPEDMGGLKYPTLMNLAMGTKLLWRLLTNKFEWWKKVLWRKYLIGVRKYVHKTW